MVYKKRKPGESPAFLLDILAFALCQTQYAALRVGPLK